MQENNIDIFEFSVWAKSEIALDYFRKSLCQQISACMRVGWNWTEIKAVMTHRRFILSHLQDCYQYSKEESAL